MARPQYANEYRKASVGSATPLQLVIMLYDGALRFIQQGRHAIQTRDIERQNESLQKAQRILSELICCLDMDKGGEIASNLFAIYTYVYNELVLANMNDDARTLDRCAKILSDLRSSWVILESQQRTSAEEPQALEADVAA